MAININSAYRIKAILDSVKGKPDKQHTHQVWAQEFNIDEADQHKKNFAISRCLADLHDEVEIVRKEMLKLNYSQSLYSANLDKCNAIFAVHTLMAGWQGLKPQITPEVITTLGFCSEILPNEEELLDQDSIDELKKMASDLREVLSKSKLSAYTINIIGKHLDKIEEAISSYKVIGAKALEEVMQSAYGEVIANESIFEKAKGSEEVRKLSAMWQKTKTVLDGVTSVNKRISGVQGMAERGQQLLDFLSNINV